MKRTCSTPVYPQPEHQIDLLQVVKTEHFSTDLATKSGFIDNSAFVLISALSYWCLPWDQKAQQAEKPFTQNIHGVISPYTRANFYKTHRNGLRKYLTLLGLKKQNFKISINGRIPEKRFAIESGFAHPGRHSILMTKELGTTFVLGITSIEKNAEPSAVQKLPSPGTVWFSQGSSRPPQQNTLCIDCGRCEQSCPVSSISNQRIDRQTCIQSLSSEVAVFPEQITENWGRRFFGCSLCQDVCPINKTRIVNRRELPKHGRIGDGVHLLKILSQSLEETHAKFKGNQMGASWVDPVALHRNAILALASFPMTDDIISTLQKLRKSENSIIEKTAHKTLQKIQNKM